MQWIKYFLFTTDGLIVADPQKKLSEKTMYECCCLQCCFDERASTGTMILLSCVQQCGRQTNHKMLNGKRTRNCQLPIMIVLCYRFHLGGGKEKTVAMLENWSGEKSEGAMQFWVLPHNSSEGARKVTIPKDPNRIGLIPWSQKKTLSRLNPAEILVLYATAKVSCRMSYFVLFIILAIAGLHAGQRKETAIGTASATTYITESTASH